MGLTTPPHKKFSCYETRKRWPRFFKNCRAMEEEEEEEEEDVSTYRVPGHYSFMLGDFKSGAAVCPTQTCCRD
jgi:hypothetical protein